MGWYKELRDIYGAPQGQWTLWCKRPKKDKEREQVMMEAILTQRANWHNVERAVSALKKERLLSLGTFLNAYRKNPLRAALLIKSSGFYQQKAARLAGLAAFVKKRYGSIAEMKKVPFRRLRVELLALNGIGPETADSVFLYAFDKPIFVIDEYTRRFLHGKKDRFYFRHARLGQGGSAVKTTYEELRLYFQDNLKKDYRLYQDFHALIVIDGKNVL